MARQQRARVSSANTETIGPSANSKFAKPLTLVAMSLGYGVVQLDVTIVNIHFKSAERNASDPTVTGEFGEIETRLDINVIDFGVFGGDQHQNIAEQIEARALVN